MTDFKQLGLAIEKRIQLSPKAKQKAMAGKRKQKRKKQPRGEYDLTGYVLGKPDPKVTLREDSLDELF